MYKTALRAPQFALPSRNLLSRPSRRFLGTAPPAQKRRGWANATARWGVAVGAVYLYSTSAVFAEEPEAAIRRLDDSIHAVQESDHPTIDAIVEEKRRREAQQAAEVQEKERLAKVALAGDENAEPEDGEGGMGGLEEEAGSQGAFNPETGEINWDCPCLGGMAHGPCGEEFRAAFSCFVYSTEEPKGVECIDKFKGMQDCFRLHPEQYGAELEEEEDEIEQELLARQNASKGEEASSEPSTESASPILQEATKPSQPKSKEPKSDDAQIAEASSKKDEKPSQPKTTSEEILGDKQGSQPEASSDAEPASEKDDELIPKAAHDATRK